MARAKFAVSYEIVTEESAAEGDAAERGILVEGARLRDAGAMFLSMASGAEVSADSWPCLRPRWLTVYSDMDIRNGDYENRSIHIPEDVTLSSARRIARALGLPATALRKV